MIDVDGLPWWKRRYPSSPAQTVLFCLAMAWVAVTVVMIATPGGFSFNEVLGYYLGFGFIGATSGYQVSISADPTRAERIGRATRVMIFLALFGSLVFFPRLWWAMFSTNSWVGLMLLGAIGGLVMYATAAAFGVAHLVGYLSGRLAPPEPAGKPRDGSAAGGVWDRDLDRGGPALGHGG